MELDHWMSLIDCTGTRFAESSNGVIVSKGLVSMALLGHRPENILRRNSLDFLIRRTRETLVMEKLLCFQMRTSNTITEQT